MEVRRTAGQGGMGWDGFLRTGLFAICFFLARVARAARGLRAPRARLSSLVSFLIVIVPIIFVLNCSAAAMSPPHGEIGVLDQSSSRYVRL